MCSRITDFDETNSVGHKHGQLAPRLCSVFVWVYPALLQEGNSLSVSAAPRTPFIPLVIIYTFNRPCSPNIDHYLMNVLTCGLLIGYSRKVSIHRDYDTNFRHYSNLAGRSSVNSKKKLGKIFPLHR